MALMDLTQPTPGTTGWGVGVNQNFQDIQDALAGGTPSFDLEIAGNAKIDMEVGGAVMGTWDSSGLTLPATGKVVFNAATEYVNSGAGGYIDVHWADNDQGCRFYSGANRMLTIRRAGAAQPTHTVIDVGTRLSLNVGITPLVQAWVGTFSHGTPVYFATHAYFVSDANAKCFFGQSGDAALYYDDANLIIDPNVMGSGKVCIGATADDDLCAANIAVGGTDTSAAPLTVTGNIRSTTTGKHEFNDSGTYIASLDNGHLDLTAEVSIDLNGLTLLDANGIGNDNAVLTFAAGATGKATFTGDVTATTFTISAVALSTNEWVNLEGLDQGLSTTKSPTFAGLTLAGSMGMGANNITNIGDARFTAAGTEKISSGDPGRLDLDAGDCIALNALTLLGTNGIGRDAGVLTFATGAAGEATFAGDVDLASEKVYRINGTKVVDEQQGHLDDPAATAFDIDDRTGGTPSGSHQLVDCATGNWTAERANVESNFATIGAEYNKLKDDVEANNAAIDAIHSLLETHGLMASS